MDSKQMISTAHSRSAQRGQGMSEYIIITALVAVAGIGLFAAFGDVLRNQMAGMSREMAGQSATARHHRCAGLGNDGPEPRGAGGQPLHL